MSRKAFTKQITDPKRITLRNVSLGAGRFSSSTWNNVLVGGVTGGSSILATSTVIQQFKNTSSWICPAGVTSINYLIVGGGGGGGETIGGG